MKHELLEVQPKREFLHFDLNVRLMKMKKSLGSAF